MTASEHADIRAADTAGMIECTVGLFRDAVRNLPPQATSGLVEQPFWFMKLQPLCEVKEAPEILAKLEALRRDLADGEDRPA